MTFSEARPERSGTVIQERLPPLGLGAFVGLPAGGAGAAAGIIIFAHGSGSSRFSPRNAHVAQALRGSGFATLLFDLLTEEEAADRANVFDIGLLADRLLVAADWVRTRPELASLPIGLFGASTGAAAALWAAATKPDMADAIVSRGGRPDLAIGHLGAVIAPTLLIVGGLDDEVLELNRKALAAIHCEKELAVVPGASHLFEEPGTLDLAIGFAASWFLDHLTGRREGEHRAAGGSR